MPSARGFARHRVMAYSSRARTVLYLATACQFGAALLVIAQAWVLADVVAGVFLQDERLENVRPAVFLLLGLVLARGALVWAGEVIAQCAASELKGRLRTDLARHMLALGPAFTQGERSGELVNVSLQAVEDLDEYVTVYQPLRALAVVVPLAVALVVLAIDPLTVLVLMVTGPMLVLLLAVIGSRTRESAQRRFAEMSWMTASFLDMLQGLATLKLFGRSREQVRTVRAVSQRFGNTTMEVLKTAFETSLVLELSGTIAVALVAVEVSFRLVAGDLAFQQALAVLIITPEFFAPLRQLAARYHAGAAGQAASERILAVLDTPAAAPRATDEEPRDALPASGDLRLEHVSFAYPGAERMVLDDVTLTIPRGRTVALVGETGSGKTTLVNLLLRFFEPDTGQITVGGVPLRLLDVAAWRSQVAWVPQRPHLFSGTIAQNIALARPDASQAEIVAAAEAAGLAELLRRLPAGLDAMIGERGARLSGGERQRLAIARAFLKDAPFLVLDEVTSHLDAASEAAIQDSLQRLCAGRTVLVIAHRLGLAYEADGVVVLQDGRVVQSGGHESLIGRDGAYRRLVLDYEGGAP